jgi:hypothetical protein
MHVPVVVHAERLFWERVHGKWATNVEAQHRTSFETDDESIQAQAKHALHERVAFD